MVYPKTNFILGSPRSGTTWFANLFNSHPDVVYRHEMIGRCYTYFPNELFNKLKYDNGLSDADYDKAIKIVLSPNIESDRAPFFPKHHLFLNNTKLHYLSWLATRALPLLEPAYRMLFQPRTANLSLVIKETRSSVNMDSILTGLRADNILILFRHPCGALASNLRGIESGKMPKIASEVKGKWFDMNQSKEYVKDLDLDKQQFCSLPDHQYLAIVWSQQNEDYLSFSSTTYQKTFISYEKFMDAKEDNIRALLERLSLNHDPKVDDFIRATSGDNSHRSAMKDSSSNFYSVYRNDKFDPQAWKKELPHEQIDQIESLTAPTLDKLIAHSEETQ